MDFEEKIIYKNYQKLIEKKITPPFFLSPQEKGIKVKLSEILNQFDVFCFDGYGTLYNRGSYVYEGALKWVNQLRDANKIIRLVTNAASNTDENLAKEANQRGFDFFKEETISSGALLKSLNQGLPVGVFNFGEGLFYKIQEAFYIGRDSGQKVLEEACIKPSVNPITPVVAISSYTITEENFCKAVEILKRENSLLVVLNPDLWAPNIDDSRIPVSGVLAEKLRKQTNCRVCYLGKPFPAIWERLKKSVPKDSRILMIGDTLGTDIYGAYINGMSSALVVGRNIKEETLSEDEIFLNIKPNFYLIPD